MSENSMRRCYERDGRGWVGERRWGLQDSVMKWDESGGENFLDEMRCEICLG